MKRSALFSLTLLASCLHTSAMNQADTEPREPQIETQAKQLQVGWRQGATSYEVSLKDLQRVTAPACEEGQQAWKALFKTLSLTEVPKAWVVLCIPEAPQEGQRITGDLTVMDDPAATVMYVAPLTMVMGLKEGAWVATVAPETKLPTETKYRTFNSFMAPATPPELTLRGALSLDLAQSSAL